MNRILDGYDNMMKLQRSSFKIKVYVLKTFLKSSDNIAGIYKYSFT